VTGRHGDVISSGRDPGRPPRLPRRWRLAAAVVLLIGGGITAGVLLAVRPAPRPHAGPTHAAHRQVAHAILHGSRAGPDVAPGTVLLLAGADLRKLSVTGRAPVRLRWPAAVHGLPGQGSLGSNLAEQVVEPVSGGFVALLANEAGCCRPAVGDVFFVPVTARGVAAPRLIAHANYLAVAPGGRDIWVQQASPPDHLPGDAWLIDRSAGGCRLCSGCAARFCSPPRPGACSPVPGTVLVRGSSAPPTAPP